ncbi:helix-turn-helix transcriptional regulator [Saccharothrix xinjiangensis]|uniref:Helix-turn-helix transcriptional regulator n=1 Tax=Saccharothrix xinjiangensis TaxID=204798 RepID=A0ABV9XY60_9PSEU
MPKRETLQQRRKKRGFTQESLAALLRVSPRTVRNWEAGTRAPYPEHRQPLADALHLDLDQLDRLLDGLPITRTEGVPSAMGTQTVGPVRQNRSTPLLLPVLINGTPVLLPLDRQAFPDPEPDLATPADGDGMSPLSRRSVIIHGIAAATLPALGLDEEHHVARALADARRYLDDDVVGYFRRQIESAMAQDHAVGARETLPVVLGIVHAVERSAHDVKPTLRRKLLAVGAQGAELCGWLYRELHQPTAGYRWLDRGMEWAQEAGDTAMQGYLLLKKSQMAYDDRDASRVLTLASAAAEGPYHLPAKVRAEVAQQEALGMAMIGEPTVEIERRIGQAEQFFTQAGDSESNSTLGVYFTEHTLRLRNANCLSEAGTPKRAATLYAHILGNVRLTKRNASLHHTRWALALARSGEPDEAAVTALKAVHAAKATHSLRTLHTLDNVVTTLTPWKTRPAVRELHQAISA